MNYLLNEKQIFVSAVYFHLSKTRWVAFVAHVCIHMARYPDEQVRWMHAVKCSQCDVESVLYVGWYSDFTAGKSNVSFC